MAVTVQQELDAVREALMRASATGGVTTVNHPDGTSYTRDLAWLEKRERTLLARLARSRSGGGRLFGGFRR